MILSALSRTAIASLSLPMEDRHVAKRLSIFVSFASTRRKARALAAASAYFSWKASSRTIVWRHQRRTSAVFFSTTTRLVAGLDAGAEAGAEAGRLVVGRDVAVAGLDAGAEAGAEAGRVVAGREGAAAGLDDFAGRDVAAAESCVIHASI